MDAEHASDNDLLNYIFINNLCLLKSIRVIDIW